MCVWYHGGFIEITLSRHDFAKATPLANSPWYRTNT